MERILEAERVRQKEHARGEVRVQRKGYLGNWLLALIQFLFVLLN